MRTHGYCLKCHKIKLITWNGMHRASKNIPVGICADCEEKRDAR